MILTSKRLALLNLLGVALLVAASVWFGSPLFGWVITAAIVLVFSVGQERYRRHFVELENEERLLHQYKQQIAPQPLGEGWIADRIRRVQELSQRGIHPDPKVLSDILSIREAARTGRSPGGLVILLGLLGTFYGLMLAISRAGASLDATQAQDTLASIHQIFSSMKGIFGTTLCGLIAALLLNLSHAVLSARQSAFVAEMEEYTLFQLLPAFAPEKEVRDDAKPMLLMAEQMSALVAKGAESIAQVVHSALEQMSGSVGQFQKTLASETSVALQSSLTSLGTVMDAMGRSVGDSLDKRIQSSDQAMESATKKIEALAQSVDAMVAASLRVRNETTSEADRIIQSQRELLNAQRDLMDAVKGRQEQEAALAKDLQQGIGESATLMRINQSEFQASLELFRQGIEALLEKFTGGSAEQESQRSFVEQLQASLDAFHEKASEVLVENAMRTQEILLEILEQSRTSTINQPSEEG